jgi:hypothetical protein
VIRKLIEGEREREKGEERERERERERKRVGVPAFTSGTFPSDLTSFH